MVHRALAGLTVETLCSFDVRDVLSGHRSSTQLSLMLKQEPCQAFCIMQAGINAQLGSAAAAVAEHA